MHTHYFSFSLSCFFSLCLAGCTPYCYRSYPYTVEQTNLARQVDEAGHSDSIAEGDGLPDCWWQFFQDRQLDRLIELSLSCHPSIQLADARIRLACQQARIARSALFPHVFGLADVKRQKVSELGEGFVPGFPDLFTETTLKLFSSVYELDIWYKNRSRFYAALSRMQAEKADYEEAKLILSSTIAAFYFDWQMKLCRMEVIEARIKAREELYALLRQQFDLGIISEYRLYEVDTDVQLLKDLRVQIEGEIAIDLHAIAALVSNPACICNEMGELTGLPTGKFNTSFPLPTTLPIDLLARRPDIVANKWLVEAACSEVWVAKANFLPRIDLIGWLGVQSIKISKLFLGKTVIGAAEIATTLPLFTAGKLKGELGIAREEFEIAINEYNQSVLNAVQEVSDALSDLITADKRKNSLEHSLKDAESLYNLVKQKYESGVSNKLALLAALENVYVQQDLIVEIQRTRFEAAVALMRAIGGGYFDSTI